MPSLKFRTSSVNSLSVDLFQDKIDLKFIEIVLFILYYQSIGWLLKQHLYYTVVFDYENGVSYVCDHDQIDGIDEATIEQIKDLIDEIKNI